MKKPVRNSILTVLCAGLIVSAGSCALGVTYPVTIDGEPLRAGIYILEQQQAVNDAMTKINDEQPDLDTSADGFSYMNQTVEGRAFSDWVNDQTIRLCRDYVAVERLFDSNALTLDSDTVKSVSDQTKSLWNDENQYAQYIYGVNIVGQYYEKLGIGEQSYKDVMISDKKKDALFEHFYGKEGTMKATDDEINTALKSDYAMINYIEYELENGSGAQSYADKITSGSTFEQVWQELTQAKNNEDFEKEQAEAAAAEADSADGADSADTAADSAETSDSSDSGETLEPAEPAQPEQAELPETDSKITIINKKDTSPSEDFVVQVMDMSDGDVKVITTEDGSSYIVQKLDILSKPDLTESQRDTLRSELKEDEFKNMIKSAGDAYSLTEDGSAKLYKIEKLLD